VSTVAAGPDGSGAQSGPEGSGSATDRFGSGVDRYRDTAKWTVAAFGAIGTVIAGSAPFAALGRSSSGWRSGYLVAGAVVALTGVTIVVVATVAVLVPRTVYRHEVVASTRGWFARTFVGLARFESLLAEHPGDLLPPGIETPDQLDQAVVNLRRGATAAAVAATADPGAAPAAANLASTLTLHEQAQRALLGVARYEMARTRFHQALVATLAGGIATGLGLGLMLFGTSGAHI
jgi:hypothetical protein